MRDRRCSGVFFMFLAVAVAGVAGVAAVGVPVAMDDSATTDHDTAVVIDVLANDDEGTNPPLSIVGVTQPANGEAEIVNGQIRYTPDPSFHGEDQFDYTIEDSASPPITAEATVTVTVHFVNRPPVAEYKALSTKRDTPLHFTLRATDPDLDAEDPDDHPLTFAIVEPPSDGTLEGDVEEVEYASPNTAYVEFTYKPDPGFTGSDTVHFTVTDPFGASSTATVEFEVVSQALPFGTLTGRWNASLTFGGPTASVDRFDTNATLFYRANGYNFQLRGNIPDSQFTTLSVVGSIPLGEAATLRSTLMFDPREPEFRYWQNVTRFTALDTDFTHTLHLTGDEGTSYSQLVGRGTLDDISFISTTRFTRVEDLGFAFHYQLVRLRWRWDMCELPVQTSLRFAKDGFDYFGFLLRDLALPWPDITPLRLFMDIDTTFTTDSKTVVPALRLRTDWVCCVRGYFALGDDLDGGLQLGRIDLYGYEIRLALERGIGFRTVTSLVSERNASLTGNSEYFEFWMLTGPITPCCGPRGRWQLVTYFVESDEDDEGEDGEGGGALFGWGMTRFVLEFPVAPTVRISNQLSVYTISDDNDNNDWGWEWKAGWTIRW